VRLVVLVLVALAGCKTYVGTSTTLRQHVPVVDGAVVRIPIERERHRGYTTDCGAARIFGIGEHDCKSTTSELASREVVGAVTIDLRSGQCRFVPGNVRIMDVRPSEIRLSQGDRTFVAGVQHVVELDAAGATLVATHLQPLSIRPQQHAGPWLTAIPWAAGETHGGVTLTRVARGVALVSAGRTIYLDHDARVIRFDGSSLVAAGATLIDVERGWQASPSSYHTGGTLRVATQTSHGHWLTEIDGDHVWIDTQSGKRTPSGISMYPIASTGTKLVAQRTDLDVILVFDTASRNWREIAYRSCVPTTP
jgi:hypothetical protein